MNRFNWACVGTGHIANEMAQGMAKLGGSFYCVTNRTKEKAIDFAKKYNVSIVYDTIDDVLADENVDIVYIATPHNSHIDIIMSALKAGKHVLCEKAITLNSAELDKAAALSKERGLILAEAMTIFHMPVYKEIEKIIDSGKLGKLKQIQVNLGSYKEYDMSNRFFNMELAGGAMLDIGVYSLSFARYFMSGFPDTALSQMKKAPTGADEQVGILLCNDDGEMATVTLSLVSKLPKLGIAGFEHGFVELDNYNRAFSAKVIYTNDGSSDIINKDSDLDALSFEVIDMERAVAGEENNMHLDYTIDVMKIMTQIRFEHNMLYPEEVGEFQEG